MSSARFVDFNHLGQVNEYGALLARAFNDDPLFRVVLARDDRREKALAGLFSLNVRYGALFGNIQLEPNQGLAVWLPPGSTGVKTGRALQAGMWRVPFLIGLNAVSKLGRLNARSEELHSRYCAEPHWYLFMLGVDPLYQGQGLGGKILAGGLARADQDGLPCYLETNNPRAVRFYQIHGFRLLAEEASGLAGVTLWPMRREPMTA
jgi:ribosomal protein S18 acetylase RimI-like enzyme